MSVEDQPLTLADQRILKELPGYWRMLANSKATRRLMAARIRALVFLAQGLERRIARLEGRVERLKAENQVLRDEIRHLRGRRIVAAITKEKRPGARSALQAVMHTEVGMSDQQDTRIAPSSKLRGA